VESYIGQGYLVEGDTKCLTIQRIEDTLHSIPDHGSSLSVRVSLILAWLNEPRVPMLWPLGKGLTVIAGRPYDLDLLPEMPGTYCEISIHSQDGLHKLIVHFEKKTIVLAGLSGVVDGIDLLKRMA